MKSKLYIIILIVFFSFSKMIYAQNDLPSNSFEHFFRNTTINYHYIEDKQIHDYSGNWDFDGDGIKDSIVFVGNGGAHLYFSLLINLSSEKKDYKFEFLSTDFPFLESIDSLVKYGCENILPKFVVHDFNEDGISDIFLNIDSQDELIDELQMENITYNQVVIYYDINNKKIIIKNYGCFLFDNLKEYLIGEWIYQYSWMNEEKKQIDFNDICPTYKMIFSQCNDSIDLKDWNKPPALMVVNMRKENVLKNLKCQTFNDNLIDTYFPLASINTNCFGIETYGHKHKFDYRIVELNEDTLVIFCFGIKHVYHRWRAKMNNKQIVVCGIAAANTKTGAVVSSKDEVCYIEKLYWDDKLIGKKVCVTGIPYSVIIPPAPEQEELRNARQGYNNTSPITLYFIKNATWRVVPEDNVSGKDEDGNVPEDNG